MVYALTNANILTGLLDENQKMIVQEHSTIIINNDTIQAIIDQDHLDDAIETIDLQGRYVMPGLINMHVHLCPSSTPKKGKKAPDYNKLSALMEAHPRILKGLAMMQKGMARQYLYSGITTIRTVGGIKDLDGQLRDAINSGKIAGPRILSSNTGISVPGGHFAGLLASESKDAEEAVKDLNNLLQTHPDWIKLMVTGGVLDAEVLGEPGMMHMSEEIIKACCDEAHRHGYKVAAHVESAEGVKAALRNGVDTIEHGAAPDEEMMQLFMEHQAADICTISPALPFVLSQNFKDVYGEAGEVNGRVVLNGIIDCAIECLKHGIPVGLGTDCGCPYVLPYDFWREIVYFNRYCHVSTDFALHTATYINASLLGLEHMIGSIEKGKCADLLILDENPLDDLSALRNVSHVVMNGRFIKRPHVKKNKKIEKALDQFLLVDETAFRY